MPESASASTPSSKNTCFLPAGLRWTGALLSATYGCGVSLHRALSTPRWAPLATICIGNLTVGGTGKTPTAKYVAERLARLGRRPAVLMRGYKGQGSDEAREVENALKDFDVPVILGSDRYASALEAQARGCDVVLLDDGFQHWNLNRDLDIVLIDAGCPFGGGHLLPQGRLREPVSALSRAGAVIVTRADSVSDSDLQKLCTRLRKEFIPAAAPLAITTHAPTEVRSLNKNAIAGEPQKKLRVADVSGAKLAAVCGLGRPEVFRQTLTDLGARVVSFQPQPDHALYTTESARAWVRVAQQAGAEALVVTEKDAVKLEPLVRELNFPIWTLAVRLKFLSGEEELWQKILSVLEQTDLRLKANCR